MIQTAASAPENFSDATVDAVCDCVSAAIAMKLAVDDLPSDPAGRRQRIDEWRAAVTVGTATQPPGVMRFADACRIMQSGGGGDAVLRTLTDPPRRRGWWRRRLRPIGGYLLVLWVCGLAVYGFTGAVIGQMLRDANAELQSLSSLTAQGGGPPVPELWVVTPRSVAIAVGVGLALAIPAILLWWPLLRRVVAEPPGRTDWQTRDRSRWLAAALPMALIVALGGPVVVGVLLSLFVPLLQFYHHLTLVVAL